MDQLMEVDQVRKAYRKYIVQLHPDKFHSDKDTNKAFLSTAIFAAVQDAHDLFRKEHGIK